MTAFAECRFDWYEITFDRSDNPDVASSVLGAGDSKNVYDDGNERVVARRLARELGGCEIVEGKGRNGYAVSYALVRGDDELARVYGRSARHDEVHVVTSGESCDEVVPILRRLWPVHRVSRVDVAADFLEDFAALDGLALEFAKERGISYRLVTDSAGGATRYLGAVSSETMVRVYKKSEQLRALYPTRADSVPEGIVRCEIQVRPGKRAMKERVAGMVPVDVWGLSRWTKHLASQVLAVDAVRVPTHSRRPTEWSRALYYLGVQYSPSVARRVLEVGREQTIAEILDALGLEDPRPF